MDQFFQGPIGAAGSKLSITKERLPLCVNKPIAQTFENLRLRVTSMVFDAISGVPLAYVIQEKAVTLLTRTAPSLNHTQPKQPPSLTEDHEF